MRCSNCGKEMSPYDATIEIQFEPNAADTGAMGFPSKPRQLRLCPDCAKSRDEVKRTFIRVCGWFFIGVLALALIGWLVGP